MAAARFAGLLAGSAACSWLAAAAAPAEEVRIPHGLHDPFAFALSTRGGTAFRVRIFPPDQDEPLDSPMVGPTGPDLPFVRTSTEEGSGIVAAIGSVIVTKEGHVRFKDIAGNIITESLPLLPGPSAVLRLARGETSELYGRGASPVDALNLTGGESDPMVCNRATYAPYYYSTDGYSALGVTGAASPIVAHYGASYKSASGTVAWHFQAGSPFELYVMPGATLSLGTQAYYSLTGAPAVPPKYAFGFSASRWGWKDNTYIDNVVAGFRKGKFPLDGIIVDFEWFTNESDYSYSESGKPYYHDFGFNPVTFPEPKKNLAALRKEGVRMAGIRKPRIGNSAVLDAARRSGWILPNGEPAGGFPPDMAGMYAKGRSIDFSRAGAREWYAEQLVPLLEAGVSFWWNDEGETSYFTYHWWNVAESKALEDVDPGRRFFSLNRAWTPGMARMGAAVWTGDVDSTWEDLRATPGMMLNWVLGGAPYVACDIGGFLGNTTGPLLARWMQVGIFMPLMRVHSVLDATPHWPWLWGEVAASVMREALDLRYKLVPYHYSLAHAQHQTGRPWIRPLVMDFPEDEAAKDIATQWMDGAILVAPILSSDSVRDVYLPRGSSWFRFVACEGPTVLVKGGTRWGQAAELGEVPAFVRPGSIVVLAAAQLQSTEDIPGGPLEVQVYAGGDASFDFFEDDGETKGYTLGQVRKTSFTWSEGSQTLRWAVSGAVNAPGGREFKELTLTLVSEGGISRSPSKAIDLGGAFSVDRDSQILA